MKLTDAMIISQAVYADNNGCADGNDYSVALFHGNGKYIVDIFVNKHFRHTITTLDATAAFEFADSYAPTVQMCWVPVI